MPIGSRQMGSAARHVEEQDDFVASPTLISRVENISLKVILSSTICTPCLSASKLLESNAALAAYPSGKRFSCVTVLFRRLVARTSSSFETFFAPILNVSLCERGTRQNSSAWLRSALLIRGLQRSIVNAIQSRNYVNYNIIIRITICSLQTLPLERRRVSQCGRLFSNNSISLSLRSLANSRRVLFPGRTSSNNGLA